MKILIKILSFSLFLYSLVYLLSETTSVAHKKEDDNTLTFLAVGFDDSPSNTDVLGVITYDVSQSTFRVIQIPRDTAVDFDGETVKINSLYAKRVNDGKNHNEALEELKNFTESLLGVKINGYLALTSQGFCDVVDFVGGIKINTANLPSALVKDMNLISGENILSGNEALSLIRYRKGYLRADLDRLDTQKVFLRALAESIRNKREKISFLRFLQTNNGISFSVDKGRAISFLLENMLKLNDSDIQIATLPGRAEKSSDIWYYVVDRERAKTLVSGYFPHSFIDFDTENKFVYSL